MITLGPERAGEILGVGALEASVTGVSTDTRSLESGDLFIALRGDRFDGHDYVEAALAAGAAGAVVDAAVWQARTAGSTAGGGRIYPVKDTLVALGALAREVRRLSGATVFAITGSAGKTSTKDILKAMVSRVRTVVATSGNQNNEVGVPLTLLRCGPDTQAVVVEMGMRGLGQIAELTSIAEPDVGVITNVHPVHMELLGSLENVAQAKAEIVMGVRRGGSAVVPAESDVLEPFLKGCSCRLVRFGAAPSGGPGAESGQTHRVDLEGWLESDGRQGQVLVVRWPEGAARVGVGRMSGHTLENATAAAAACWAAGLSVEDCVTGLADVELSDGRGQLLEVGGLCVIDDTYNANPAAMRAALDELARLGEERGGRAVAVLGDMLEMGEDSARYHAEIGEHAAALGVSVMWGVGPMSAATVEGFGRWSREHARTDGAWKAERLDSCEQAEAVIAGLRAGDVVLVKGSRGARLENVVVRLVTAAREGRWGEGDESVDVDDDSTGEKRHCYR